MKTIKKLKPLHVVLAENPGYRITGENVVINSVEIWLGRFAPGYEISLNDQIVFPGSWFEEVEVKEPLTLRFEDRSDFINLLESHLVSFYNAEYYLKEIENLKYATVVEEL